MDLNQILLKFRVPLARSMTRLSLVFERYPTTIGTAVFEYEDAMEARAIARIGDVWADMAEREGLTLLEVVRERMTDNVRIKETHRV